MKPKESGAEGRKRRKLEEKENKKSSNLLMTYLEKSEKSSSKCFPQTSSSSTRSLEFDRESPVQPPSDKSENEEENEISRKNAGIITSETEGDTEFSDKILPSNTAPIEMKSTVDSNSTSVVPEVVKNHDIGLLKFDKASGNVIVSDALRMEIIKLGSKYFQNNEGPFEATNNRSMTKSWFKRKLGNGLGEEVNRSWLVYSPSKASAYCICCLLFSTSKHLSALELECGFIHWKAPERISTHENAENHRKCFIKWKEIERNLIEGAGVIDAKLMLQIEIEKQKWRDILMRILHCIKFLATQNLALRGHRESLQTNNDSNMGNFLGLIKLLAVFDPVMKEHLLHIESHPGSLSYFSPNIQNEFIHMIASTVRQNLLKSIRKAKYYGLMFDSTPDLAHREQMSEVVRFVEIDFEKKTVRVREIFLGFMLLSAKDAKSLFEDITKQLEEDEMRIEDCRSQCYDNAPVMSGHISGVYQRMLEKNNRMAFVNCTNHSLNLVGVHTAKQETMMVTFFGIIQTLYNFFSRSTQRWEKLKKIVPIVVKSESETRWSAKTESVKPVHSYLNEILQVLEDMTDDVHDTSDTRSEAKQLYNCMLSYDFLILLGFWNDVLIHIDRVQKRLQDPKMNFHDAALDVKALRDHFQNERETLVTRSLKEGIELCQKWDVKVEKRQRRKKRMAGENARDAGLTAEEEIDRVMKATLDRLYREMNERFIRLDDINTKFGFLLNIKELCYRADTGNLEEKCENLGKFYSSDLDGQQLYEEIMDCRMLLTSRTDTKLSQPAELLEFIVQYGAESVFPNLRIAIKIMLTIAVSIASCERSFSKLKLILSYLRASMGQGRLCDLALLSIEREETEKADFNDIIDQFASVKARKAHI